ncbi:hypothetical protein [Defluviimonas salinarum]|uniref:Uncharacterized protein n=1 Tax=Defluviimonas salinarum TaxID=2992147 RepID=A0ABT3J518_9RHOB|nr:hypothetical protein [Defluviimonas salinarum]MCW3782560.1 hypothetical protein [Defluviimonas salinarum]
MKTPLALLRGQTALAGAFVLAAGILMPGVSHADWIESALDPRCDQEDKDAISSAVRDAIEASVRRAEASIQAPTPVGDLGCLNDLMTAPLDTFSNIGGLLGSLTGGLGNFDAASLGIDMDVSGTICRLAAEKWAELTPPLSDLGGTLQGFASMPSDALGRISTGGFGSDGSGTMMPSYSGMMNLTDSSGYGGSIDNYVTPNTSPSVGVIPDYNDIADLSPEEIAAYEAASAQYEEELLQALGDYIGCRVTSGTVQYDRDNRTSQSSSCTFAPSEAPALPTSGAATAVATTAGVAAEFTSGEEAADREGGQVRPEAPTAAPAAIPMTPQQTIWDLMTNGATDGQ